MGKKIKEGRHGSWARKLSRRAWCSKKERKIES